MIQIERGSANSGAQYFYLNVVDKMTNTDYKPLIGITSQLSKETVYFIPFNFTLTNKSRYALFSLLTVVLPASEVLTLGFLYLGTENRPFGLYDVTMYQNTSNTNLDPSGLTTIWNGLMNLTSTSNFPAVEYEEYTTNDSDTESVYITF
jgi:hypothetical protein